MWWVVLSCVGKLFAQELVSRDLWFLPQLPLAVDRKLWDAVSLSLPKWLMLTVSITATESKPEWPTHFPDPAHARSCQERQPACPVCVCQEEILKL